MKLAVLADVHGNLPALEAVLDDVETQRVDGIIVAGDFAGGPQPREVFDWLRASATWIIRGNGEDYLLDYYTGVAPAGWRDSGQWASMRWSYDQFTARDLDEIAAMPEQQVLAFDGLDPIRVLHGSPRRATEHVRPDPARGGLTLHGDGSILLGNATALCVRDAVALIGEPVMICGHSHVPWSQRLDGRLALNPGSVGNPLNGDVRAQYALLVWDGSSWAVTHRALPYDLNLVRRAFQASGYLDVAGAFALTCLLSVETGYNATGEFLTHAARLAHEAGCGGAVVVPDDVWQRAIDSFDWASWEARRQNKGHT